MFLAEFIDGLLVVLGTLLGVLVLYLCARVASKAWYRSKREEEESAAARRINDNIKDERGGINHGNKR
jgi:uncharacterized membrane protein YdjX (TVP38/TMEM64 family)